MTRQQQEGEAQQWNEEAGWLQADPAYLEWLLSLGPWYRALNDDEQWIKDNS
jgi:hypothetical protein